MQSLGVLDTLRVFPLKLLMIQNNPKKLYLRILMKPTNNIQQRLHRGMSSIGIYAFLPTEMVTNFPFVIQADFLLASSRETILLDNKWNQGILDCVASAFINAFVSLVKTSKNAPISMSRPEPNYKDRYVTTAARL